jgi:MFS transporter, SHS family, lactate transporter
MADHYNEEKVASSGHDSPAPIHLSEDPEKMSAGRYAATRLSTLKPPMHKAPNPFKLLAMLNTQQWLFFLVAFLAWVRSSPSFK